MERKALELKEQHVNVTERTFEGYASTWDIDLGGDKIHPGAFIKSINEGFPAGRIKVLWQHADPIGMPTAMHEDDKGLYVKAKVSKTALGDEALELMKDGVVDRMSIGFIVPRGKSEYDEEENIRHIREVKLMEFSPVTFPMNEAAVITGVKQIQDALAGGARVDDPQALLEAIKSLQALIEGSTQKPADEVDAKGIISTLDGFRDKITAMSRGG